MIKQLKLTMNSIINARLALKAAMSALVLSLFTLQAACLAVDAAKSKTDISNINWDAEAEKSVGTGAVKQDLSSIYWEDEGTDSDQKADSADADRQSKEEYRVLKKKERFAQIIGFIVFTVYLFGCFITAYYTRNRKLAVNCPPEALILLHAFWPIQWLALPFVGQKVR